MMLLQRILFNLCAHCKRGREWKRESIARKIGFTILYAVVARLGL
jgi:hypothetical protein